MLYQMGRMKNNDMLAQSYFIKGNIRMRVLHGEMAPLAMRSRLFYVNCQYHVSLRVIKT